MAHVMCGVGVLCVFTGVVCAGTISGRVTSDSGGAGCSGTASSYGMDDEFYPSSQTSSKMASNQAQQDHIGMPPVYVQADSQVFALLASYWGMIGCSARQPCARVDWYRDGTIDILDLRQLVSNWLGEVILPNVPLLWDDFNDGDYDGWTIVDQGTDGDPSSDWSAETGLLVQSNRVFSRPGDSAALLKAGTFAKYNGGYDWTNYSVSCSLRSDWPNDYGIMFRVQDNNNYYRFSWRSVPGGDYPPYTRIVKVVDGQAAMLAEVQDYAFEVGRPYSATIVVEGSDIALFVDGVLILETQDNALTRGTVALYCYGNKEDVSFDNVVVECK